MGILLGPVTGVVPAGEHLGLFFDVSVVLLFFLVGVDEIDIAGFIRTIKKRLFIAAVVAFAIPLAIGVPVIYYVLDHHMATAIALSGILALSSLGVAARVLGDLGQLKRPIGLEIFTVVVLVEVAGLLVVAFTIEELEHTEHVNQFHPVQAAILVGQIAVFSIVAWFLGSRVFVPVVTRLRQFLAAPQLSFGLFLGALFLIVVAAGTDRAPRLPGSASAGSGAFTTASQAQVRGAAGAAKRGARVLRAAVLRVGGTAPERLLPPPAPHDHRRGHRSRGRGQACGVDAGPAPGRAGLAREHRLGVDG